MMRIEASALLLILLISSNLIASTISTCTADGDCVTSDLSMTCPQGKGPRRATSICYSGSCYSVPLCSITLGGKCSGGCATPDICELCKSNQGPPCAQSRCMGGYCAEIAPCSLTMN
jgi:hypothetical protein